MKFTMIGQEKGDLLIQVTTWAGLTVYFLTLFYSTGIVIYIHFVYILKKADVVEWSRALDVRLSEWCCSVSMV